MTERTIVVVEKATGKRYIGAARQSWQRTYYSFDRGVTFHASKLEAFRQAQRAGKLWEAGDR